MNLYRTIDRAEFQFDFLTHPPTVDTVYSYEEEIKDLGGKVYKAPSFIKDPVAYKRFIVSFFDEHPEYRIVHAHNLDSAALAYMPIVKKHGCYLIAHAHNDKERGSLLRRSLINLTHRIIRRYPDYFYACSDEAGTFFFGKEVIKSGNYAIPVPVRGIGHGRGRGAGRGASHAAFRLHTLEGHVHRPRSSDQPF